MSATDSVPAHDDRAKLDPLPFVTQLGYRSNGPVRGRLSYFAPRPAYSQKYEEYEETAGYDELRAEGVRILNRWFDQVINTCGRESVEQVLDEHEKLNALMAPSDKEN